MIECYRQWPQSWNRGGNFSFRRGLLLTFWLQEGNGMERFCISAGHCLLHCTPLLAGNMRNFLQVQFPSVHDMDIISYMIDISYISCIYLFVCLLVCSFVVSLWFHSIQKIVYTLSITNFTFYTLHCTRLCCVTSCASYHLIISYHSIIHSLHFVTCNHAIDHISYIRSHCAIQYYSLLYIYRYTDLYMHVS